MKSVTGLLIASLCTACLVGCSDTSKSTQETTISTPGGTTSIKVEKEVKKTGENPP